MSDELQPPRPEQHARVHRCSIVEPVASQGTHRMRPCGCQNVPREGGQQSLRGRAASNPRRPATPCEGSAGRGSDVRPALPPSRENPRPQPREAEWHKAGRRAQKELPRCPPRGAGARELAEIRRWWHCPSLVETEWVGGRRLTRPCPFEAGYVIFTGDPALWQLDSEKKPAAKSSKTRTSGVALNSLNCASELLWSCFATALGLLWDCFEIALKLL